MRLRSVRQVTDAARETAGRYPFVLVAAAAAATAAFLLLENPEGSGPFRLLLAATLGIPLLFALTAFGQRSGRPAAARLVPPVIALALLGGFFLVADRWLEPVLMRRYAQFSLGLHALVAFLPYAGRREDNGFWQFNRMLFLRFLVAVLFSGVLFAGLALALAAVDKLFGVDVPEENFARLWFVIAFLFNTWYFLGGVPRRLGPLDESDEYPPVLKVFAQFILVPIVLVYLAILTTYLGRVAITREWPSGWIGYLVSSVSVVGILALLLVHPVRNRPENRWVGTFARGFWIALLPALVMLFLAIGKRIGQYGVTENRYFLLAFAVWLAGLAVYFIASRAKNIAVIPWSLCLVALGTSFGPWGAYAVSRGSQIDRLDELLGNAGVVVGGTVPDASFEQRREISAAVRYLVEHHGPGTLEPWFPDGVPGADSAVVRRAGPPSVDAEGNAKKIVSAMGLEYAGRWSGDGPERFAYSVSKTSEAMDVRGYDYAFDTFQIVSVPDGAVPVAGDESLRFRAFWDAETRELVVLERERRLIGLPVDALLVRARDTDARQGALTRPLMRIEARNDSVRAAVDVEWIAGTRGESGAEVTDLRGTVYLDLPD